MKNTRFYFEKVHEGRRLRFLSASVIAYRRFVDIKLWTIPSYWKLRFWPRCWVLGPFSVEWGRL